MRQARKSGGWNKRRLYDEAAALADEIHYGCRFGTRSDRNIWAAWFYAHPEALAACRERAYFCASLERQRQLHDAITAFQAWLNKLGRGGAR